MKVHQRSPAARGRMLLEGSWQPVSQGSSNVQWEVHCLLFLFVSVYILHWKRTSGLNFIPLHPSIHWIVNISHKSESSMVFLGVCVNIWKGRVSNLEFWAKLAHSFLKFPSPSPLNWDLFCLQRNFFISSCFPIRWNNTFDSVSVHYH